MRCSKYLYIHQKTYWKHKLYYVPLIYKESIPNITPYFCLFVLLRLPGVVLTQQGKSCRNLWPNHQSLKRKFTWRKWGLKGEKQKWLWRRRDLHVGGRAAAAAWSQRLQVRSRRSVTANSFSFWRGNGSFDCPGFLHAVSQRKSGRLTRQSSKGIKNWRTTGQNWLVYIFINIFNKHFY